uniref:uncharacterized protein K02A2.6-like n=1 Tax=Styela clava TaxID=7725 RepID=UPI00193A7CD1|nr:uncharacterized protein K02A2.6-like [Styela clava]
MTSASLEVAQFNINRPDEWQQWLRRFENMCLAMSVDNAERKKALLLHFAGPEVFDLYENLPAPPNADENDNVYANTVKKLDNYFVPKINIDFECDVFRNAKQKFGENIDTYVARLRKLAVTCDFTDADREIKQQVISGGCDSRVREKALQQRMSLRELLDYAKSLEQAKQQTKQIEQRHTRPEKLYKIDVQREKNSDSKFKPRAPQLSSAGGVSSVQNNNVGVKCNPIYLDLDIDGKNISWEVDTGATLSVMSLVQYKKLWPKAELNHTDVKLSTYTGESIPVEGERDVTVTYQNGNPMVLPITVVRNSNRCKPLLGRNWLKHIKLDWNSIFKINYSDVKISTLLDKYPELSSPGLGCAKTEAKLEIEDSVKPKFYKPRPVPLALKELVEAELDRQVEIGVLKPCKTSDWAAPMVTVLKDDQKSVRLCGSYDLTVNKASRLEQYPLPKVDELLTKFASGEKFSVIDLKEAYLQIPLAEESQKYTVVNTHKGLFTTNRLVYGISSAPAIFQRYLETLLGDMAGVGVFQDDIGVTGSSDKEHIARLEEVFKRLTNEGLKINPNKCKLMVSEITYLGYRINKLGVQPTEDNLRAVLDAPEPQNIHQLRSYLGMLNYYDASPYGIGAVLSVITQEGERPVAFASRSLSKPERNYSQLDREGLALVFAVTKFHSFSYGRPFVLETDHKPLLGLLGKNKPLPVAAPPRMIRWKVLLDGYQYELVYVPGKNQANSDALSRLPLPVKPDYIPPCGLVVNLLEAVDSTLVKVDAVQSWTRRDPVLSAVMHHAQMGWPKSSDVDPELQIYRSKETELSVHENCLFWGCRVIIPPQGRQKVLQLLHDGHPGICSMKRIARNHVWWPGVDADIEELVKSCSLCQQLRPSAPQVPASPWSYPNGPWQRIHMDYAGPVDGEMLLVIVDAFSKWPDVWITSSVSAHETIEKVRLSFATHGLPLVVVTDNAGCFAGDEFATFLKANGVKHLFSPPRHPASNGQAESMVKQVKLGLKKQAPASLSVRLVRWLFKYRTTPHTTTGQTPSELLFRRKIRTHLDLIAPSSRLKKSAENVPSGIIRTFHIDDPVVITEVVGSRFKWLPATVTEVMGQMCRVRLNDGRIFRRHFDHIRHRFSADDVMVREGNQDFRMSERIPAAIPTGIPDVDVGDRNSTPTSTATEETDESQNDRDNVDPVPNFPESSSNSNIPYKTRSGRISKPPEKLSL